MSEGQGAANARRIGVLATTCAKCGTVRLYVGSHFVGAINLYSASTHRRPALLLSPFPLRSGTVRVVTRGTGLVQMDGVVISRL